MSVIVKSRVTKPLDRRARRSRAAIVAAFSRLILERGYAELTPGGVAEAADVGRSTFYEHFGGLDDLLTQTLGPVLEPLAAGCLESTTPDAAFRTVEHLWENRRVARALLCSDAYPVVLRSFAAHLTSALSGSHENCRTKLEPEIIGLQMAAGQLTVLSAWISGRSKHSAREIANALHTSGRASLMAMLETTQTPEP